jgi:hypothetical protein
MLCSNIYSSTEISICRGLDFMLCFAAIKGRYNMKELLEKLSDFKGKADLPEFLRLLKEVDLQSRESTRYQEAYKEIREVRANQASNTDASQPVDTHTEDVMFEQRVYQLLFYGIYESLSIRTVLKSGEKIIEKLKDKLTTDTGKSITVKDLEDRCRFYNSSGASYGDEVLSGIFRFVRADKVNRLELGEYKSSAILDRMLPCPDVIGLFDTFFKDHSYFKDGFKKFDQIINDIVRDLMEKGDPGYRKRFQIETSDKTGKEIALERKKLANNFINDVIISLKESRDLKASSEGLKGFDAWLESKNRDSNKSYKEHREDYINNYLFCCDVKTKLDHIVAERPDIADRPDVAETNDVTVANFSLPAGSVAVVPNTLYTHEKKVIPYKQAIKELMEGDRSAINSRVKAEISKINQQDIDYLVINSHSVPDDEKSKIRKALEYRADRAWVEISEGDISKFKTFLSEEHKDDINNIADLIKLFEDFEVYCKEERKEINAQAIEQLQSLFLVTFSRERRLMYRLMSSRSKIDEMNLIHSVGSLTGRESMRPGQTASAEEPKTIDAREVLLEIIDNLLEKPAEGQTFKWQLPFFKNLYQLIIDQSSIEADHTDFVAADLVEGSEKMQKIINFLDLDINKKCDTKTSEHSLEFDVPGDFEEKFASLLKDVEIDPHQEWEGMPGSCKSGRAKTADIAALAAHVAGLPLANMEEAAKEQKILLINNLPRSSRRAAFAELSFVPSMILRAVARMEGCWGLAGPGERLDRNIKYLKGGINPVGADQSLMEKIRVLKEEDDPELRQNILEHILRNNGPEFNKLLDHVALQNVRNASEGTIEILAGEELSNEQKQQLLEDAVYNITTSKGLEGIRYNDDELLQKVLSHIFAGLDPEIGEHTSQSDSEADESKEAPAATVREEDFQEYVRSLSDEQKEILHQYCKIILEQLRSQIGEEEVRGQLERRFEQLESLFRATREQTACERLVKLSQSCLAAVLNRCCPHRWSRDGGVVASRVKPAKQTSDGPPRFAGVEGGSLVLPRRPSVADAEPVVGGLRTTAIVLSGPSVAEGSDAPDTQDRGVGTPVGQVRRIGGGGLPSDERGSTPASIASERGSTPAAIASERGSTPAAIARKRGFPGARTPPLPTPPPTTTTTTTLPITIAAAIRAQSEGGIGR